MMKPILACDPGRSGGFAIRDEDGSVTAENMPGGMVDIADRLREIKLQFPDIECVLEKTGTYRPGNSGPAACTFSRHLGHLESILYTLGIPTKQVAPSVWMKRLGTMPKDKTARKNKIKTDMACLYPAIKVTLKTADALGILTVAIMGEK
jgi:hypothetical protein